MRNARPSDHQVRRESAREPTDLSRLARCINLVHGPIESPWKTLLLLLLGYYKRRGRDENNEHHRAHSDAGDGTCADGVAVLASSTRRVGACCWLRCMILIVIVRARVLAIPKPALVGRRQHLGWALPCR